MRNLQSIYIEMLKQLTSSNKWKDFLSFSARIHKYPFDQAILVYAQNPHVTMLATEKIWGKVKRSVTPNSKAIMVTKYEKGNQVIDYLFDIKQTTGVPLQKPAWEVHEEEKQFIIDSFPDINSMSIEGKIDLFTEEIVNKIYLTIEDHCEDAFKEYNGTEKDEKLAAFYNLALDSTQYMVQQKCGFEQKQYDFSFVENIQDLYKVNVLGNWINKSTKSVLRKIAQLKKEYNLERNGKHGLQNGRRREAISRNSNQQRESIRSTSREFRETSNDVSTRKRFDSIFSAPNGRNSNGEDASSRSGSEGKNNQFDGTTREKESIAKDGKHSSNNGTQKPIESTSRRNSIERIHLSKEIEEKEVVDPKPVSKEIGFLNSSEDTVQLELFNDWDSIGEEKKVQTDNKENKQITQKVIDDTLKKGPNVFHSKFRIAEFFSNKPTSKETVRFLKKEYGIGGWGGPNRTSVSFDSKGIELDYFKLLKWDYVAKRIQQLINQDKYFSAKEKIEFEAYLNGDNQDKDDVATTNKVIDQNQESDEEIVPIQNYQYDSSDNLYTNGDKAKYKNNVAAIRLLKQLEEENMLATPEQQKVLARYVGWGGLANVFNPDNQKWSNEYTELKVLLTEKEYREAMESTITAYYTDQKIISKMYDTLKQLGFEKGNILDPAMGTGNFFSVLPDNLRSSSLTGVELDSITGRIAKQLYPEANILVQGFETTKFNDNQFDVVMGNIPFNNIHISDKRYDEHKFLIHDYFIAKSLDVVKPGGIVAFITSKGTLDKKSTKTREYIAERSELLGAIRLPNNAFKKLAGTEVTSDILFLKKREDLLDVNDLNHRPSWVDTSELHDQEIEINNYFYNNPDMVLGDMIMDGFYDGVKQSTCVPHEDTDLIVELDKAIQNVKGTFSAIPTVSSDIINTQSKGIDNENKEIEASSDIKNYTYVVKDDELYYCENKKLIPQKLGKKETERIKGLCAIRTALQDVIHIQSDDYNPKELSQLQQVLNDKYDSFVINHGFINQRPNKRAFFEDIQLPLLLSIEKEQDDGKFTKAEIFYKATIRPQQTQKKAKTALEALEISLNRHMKVDMPYMSQIYNKDVESTIAELGDKIYLNPKKYNGDLNHGWELSDEYLTGNVRDKLEYAKLVAKSNPDLFARNVRALEDVLPAPLLPGDISFRIGSPWIPKEYYEQFMHELLETPGYLRTSRYGIQLTYAPYTNTWRVEGKNNVYGSVKASSVYGTKRRNAYQIFEDCLNLQESTVKDPVKYIDGNGNEQKKYVINPKETMIVRSKQQEIQESFRSWLFRDSERSKHLLTIYNTNYNAIRPRTYTGDYLAFPDMNEEMQLRPHQKDAAARILFTGRALLAHEVGAGKTATMIAAAMKMKQVGSVKKPMFVVMNHTVDQWAKEFMRFYPGANILITTKKDFEKQNRQRFVSKIATGDYDAIIIGHSQFEKIPISKEREENILRKEINTLSYEISEAKKSDGRDWSVKQLVIFQKSLENRLKKLMNEDKKDRVIDFENLGVDFLFVDEAHVYKNLYTVTKLKNVAGIGTSSSQRATDMKMKCEYIQEVNQGKGVVFATATPITNSMSELFVMQRFLQPEALNRAGLEFFDNWAGTFGEVVSSLEMTPEGSGYRMKSRFSKFHNLPELMSMFNLVADIQTSEMLNLPVPELVNGKAEIVVSECSDYQQEKMDEFVERSEKIRSGEVDPSEDNMLKLTHEAKLMAIDPRLIDENAPTDENSKINKCVYNVYQIWDRTTENQSTQMIFCDSGTPKSNQFNVYDEIKNQLMKKGVPGEEIAFIHDAKTDAQRDKLFAKVRKGEVRVLIGSTSKVGTGTNVQDKLIAGHHIDCPWRPADLTQRDGRIVRQGNSNNKVAIFRYVTKGTFDSYLWQIQEQKLRYISQVMTGKNISRSCEDTDETVLSAAEVKAVATGNPLLLEKMTLDNEVERLKLVESRWKNEKAVMEQNLTETYPNRIKEFNNKIREIKDDLFTVNNYPEGFEIELDGMTFTCEKEAGKALKAVINTSIENVNEKLCIIGKYKGLDVYLRRDSFTLNIGLKGKSNFDVEVKSRERANIQRLTKIPTEYENKIMNLKEGINQVKMQLNTVEKELKKPFPYKDELKNLKKKQSELNLKMEFGQELNNQEDNEMRKQNKKSKDLGIEL